MIILARHPGPDVRRTIAKNNTSSSFVLSQETDGVTIGEDQIRQIQNKDTTGRLDVNELTQFVHIVRVKMTADREHDRSATRAMDFEHRLGRTERNCRANGKCLNLRECGGRGKAKFRQW